MVDDEAKKVIWSLQNNKRTEAERNVFEPTGKKPMNKNVIYVDAIGYPDSVRYELRKK